MSYFEYHGYHGIYSEEEREGLWDFANDIDNEFLHLEEEEEDED